MDVVARRPLSAPPFPWRTVALLVMLAVALAAAVVAVGSLRQAPAPYGPARNGSVAYGEAGDIYSLDAATGASTAIVTGSPDDFAPWFSRDGTKLLPIQPSVPRIASTIRPSIGPPNAALFSARMIGASPGRSGRIIRDSSMDEST